MVSGRRKKIETKSWARPNSKTGTGHHPPGPDKKYQTRAGGRIAGVHAVQDAAPKICRLPFIDLFALDLFSNIKNRNADNRQIGKVFLQPSLFPHCHESDSKFDCRAFI